MRIQKSKIKRTFQEILNKLTVEDLKRITIRRIGPNFWKIGDTYAGDSGVKTFFDTIREVLTEEVTDEPMFVIERGGRYMSTDSKEYSNGMVIPEFTFSLHDAKIFLSEREAIGVADQVSGHVYPLKDLLSLRR